MRYSTRQYVKAFWEALSGKREEEQILLMRNFLKILAKNRDLSRLGLILKEIQRHYFREAGLKKIEVESAAPIPPAIKKELVQIFGEKIYIKESIKPGLLAGIKIIIDDTLLIDASGRKMIEQLFYKKNKMA